LPPLWVPRGATTKYVEVVVGNDARRYAEYVAEYGAQADDKLAENTEAMTLFVCFVQDGSRGTFVLSSVLFSFIALCDSGRP
jgi:hypothetical protein